MDRGSFISVVPLCLGAMKSGRRKGPYLRPPRIAFSAKALTWVDAARGRMLSSAASDPARRLSRCAQARGD